MEQEKQSKRGGRRAGQGRKPLYQEPLERISIRLTKEQRALLMALGGTKWVRQELDNRLKILSQE